MKKTAAVMLIVVASVVWGACAKYAKSRTSQLPKKEWIAIAVGMDKGICKVVEQRPGEIRTEAGSTAHWIVTGNCPGTKISLSDFSRKGQPVKHDQLFESAGTVFSGTLPAMGEESVLRLRGRFKPGLQKAHYQYRLMINDTVAQFRSPGDDGDIYMCPIWPCGDFN